MMTHANSDSSERSEPAPIARVGSGVWLGSCRWRIDEVPAFRSYYFVVFGRIGIVVKIAKDGTPWTRHGRKYHLDFEGEFARFALGKYALGILKGSVPNDKISNPHHEH